MSTKSEHETNWLVSDTRGTFSNFVFLLRFDFIQHVHFELTSLSSVPKEKSIAIFETVKLYADDVRESRTNQSI